MPTVINGLSRFETTNVSSEATTGPVEPFSMDALLPVEANESDESALDATTLDETSIQETLLDEQLDASEEQDDAAWLAYWNLIPTPMVNDATVLTAKSSGDGVSTHQGTVDPDVFNQQDSAIEQPLRTLSGQLPQTNDALLSEPMSETGFDVKNNRKADIGAKPYHDPLDTEPSGNFKIEPQVSHAKLSPLQPQHSQRDSQDQVEMAPTLIKLSSSAVEQHAPSPSSEGSAIQELTKHLTAYLSQPMSLPQPVTSTTTIPQALPNADLQGQLKMELVSIQQDPTIHLQSVNTEHYTAQIKVHPEDMGEITAKIEVNDGVATISFMTEHLHVKQLMETNMPELRQAFQQSSLNLDQVDVHHGAPQDKREHQQHEHEDEKAPWFHEKQGAKTSQSYTIKTNRSLIDTYA